MKMKKIATIVLAAVMVLSLAACSGEADGKESTGNHGGAEPSQSRSDESKTPEDSGKPNGSGTSSKTESQSRQSGQTPDGTVSEPDQKPEGSKILVAYFSATNNTEGVAQKLAEGLGADLYEITPSEPYTDADLNYGNSGSRTSAERNDPSARPAISGSVENMAQYDVVFIGYPIWWGEAPRIMSTFIESYDFSGKTLVAFCTSASSGFGSSDSALRSAANGATWLDGHRFPAGAESDEVLAWASGLEIG